MGHSQSSLDSSISQPSSGRLYKRSFSIPRPKTLVLAHPSHSARRNFLKRRSPDPWYSAPTPNGHPPYEHPLDWRLPEHFSGDSSISSPHFVDENDELLQARVNWLAALSQRYLRSRGFDDPNAFVELVTSSVSHRASSIANPNASSSALFFAVWLRPEDAYRWPDVDQDIRRLIWGVFPINRFPAIASSPVRYMLRRARYRTDVSMDGSSRSMTPSGTPDMRYPQAFPNNSTPRHFREPLMTWHE